MSANGKNTLIPLAKRTLSCYNTKNTDKERYIMFEKIVDKLSEYLQVDKSRITMDTNIRTDLGADSLTVVELLFALEQEYGITIPDDVVESLETVGSLVDYLEKTVKQ